MKSYPSYKDSGVPARHSHGTGGEWIGEIPSGWDVKKLKYVSDIFSSSVDRHIHEDEIQVSICHYPDVYNNEFINDEIELNKGSCNQVEFQRYILKKGLVILTKDSETPDDIGNPCYVEIDFDNVVCGYHLTIIENNDIDVNSKFLFRFIQSDKVRCHFETESRGITRFSLGKSKIENLFVNLPSYSEQSQIVSFLDTKTQKIDELIEKTEKKIELLKEKRTSLINHCVTKGLPAVERAKAGLNPNVEMKDSGVKWIGEIPSHWEISKFKYISEIVTGNTPSKTEEELYYTDSKDGFLWVKPTSLNIRLGYVNESVEHLTIEGKNQTRVIPKDSIMICCIGNTIGKHSMSGQELSTNQQINSVIPNQHKIHPWFCLFYVNVFTRDLIKWSNFVTLPIYTKSDLEETLIILPPIDEQNDIITKLVENNEITDITIKKETQRIELLKEYRQSLISEVVTGKVDVRGWKG